MTILAAILIGAFSAGGTATAADAGSEVATLEMQLTRDEAALSTRDCSEACRALGSMRRAAERLCQLDPGPKCKDARARVQSATDRVRGACPECAAAKQGPPLENVTPPPAQPQPPESAPPRPTPATMAGSAREESAPRKGGCAGCAVDALGSSDGIVGGLAVAVLAAVLRRRARRRAGEGL